MDQIIILFIGLASLLAGVFILIFQLVSNRGAKTTTQIDINESLDFERNISPNPDLRRPISSPPVVSSPYSALQQTTVTAPPASMAPYRPTEPAAPPAGLVTNQAPVIGTPTTSGVTSIIGALEALIQAHMSGAIDNATYETRKAQLLQSYNSQQSGNQAVSVAAPSSTPPAGVGSAPAQHTSMEELVIDYAEGLISEAEYEAGKMRLQSR